MRDSEALTWDEAKRQRNLEKHGLDFADASRVLESPWRMDVDVVRNGERRTQSFAYAFERLCVLCLTHMDSEAMERIVSFRVASKLEREAYVEWLANEFIEKT